MYELDVLQVRNTEAVIKGILARAELTGLEITRAEVLEELKFRETDDTSVWGETVDRLMGVQS